MGFMENKRCWKAEYWRIQRTNNVALVDAARAAAAPRWQGVRKAEDWTYPADEQRIQRGWIAALGLAAGAFYA